MAIIKAAPVKATVKSVVKAAPVKAAVVGNSKGASKGQNRSWGNSSGSAGYGNNNNDILKQLTMLLGGGGGGGGSWGKGGGGSWGNVGGNFKIDKSGGELGEFTGTIKRFNPRTNYGFIECPELAEYGDVFLHGDMKKGYQESQTVKFTCVVNAEGKPVAIDLKSGLKSGGGAARPSTGVSRGGGGGGGFKVDRSGGELGEFVGTIKSFGWKTNYGFIECPELKEYGDVFLHGDMKKGYQQGQKVKFTCIVNAEGKPVAIDLKSGLK